MAGDPGIADAVEDCARILLDAIAVAERVGPEAVRACMEALTTVRSDEARAAAYDALIAIIDAWPTLDPCPVLEVAQRDICDLATPPVAAERALDLLRLLALTEQGTHARDAMFQLLGSPDLPPDRHVLILDALVALYCWRPGRLTLPEVVTILEHPHLGPLRTRLLREVVTPVALASPASIEVSSLRQIVSVMPGDADVAYLLWYLAGHPGLPADARDFCREAMPEFPLQSKVRNRLRDADLRVLVVANVRDGQGDEILRVTPILQALLDANPSATARIVTARPYLYAHPRVDVTPIDDPAAMARVTDPRFDVIIDLHEFDIPTVMHRPELEAGLRERQASSPAFLWLRSRKGDNQGTYETVELDGEPWSERLGLDRRAASNLHEPVMRLLAELGLPVRFGDMATATEPILAGIPCQLADVAWRRHTVPNTQVRPVALLNLFGGAEPLKGFTEETVDQAAPIARSLIADGYFVLLLLNGESWGGQEMAGHVLARLSEDERRAIAVGPDPADPGGLPQVLPNGLTVPHAAATMHLVAHFIRRADLIVSVEGWMVHAAYALGRPYGVLMAPYSFTFDWHPYGRSLDQRPYPEEAVADPWRPGQPPPLVGGTRKLRLGTLLAALGRCPRPEAAAPLVAALKSRDRDIRRAAAAALRGHSHLPTVQRVLLHALDDDWYRVRGAAAESLELSGREYRTELGPGYRTLLAGHRAIAATPRVWPAILALGHDVWPAVERSSRDQEASIAREAGALVADRAGEHAPVDRKPLRSRSGLLRRLVPGDHKRAPSVLILTPVKDAETLFPEYVARLKSLSYPHNRLSLGLLESDSLDDTWGAAQRLTARLRREFRRARAWKRDFGYVLPDDLNRGHPSIQPERRTVLARSRNHLLFRALDDEEWVLWLDVDVEEYPTDLIERLLATGKDIVHPHCVLRPGGPTFDRNAWRDAGRLHLDDLRGEGDLVPLDAVGGTVLLVRADLHRDGLVFPAFPYGRDTAPPREGRAPGEYETEGLGLMARDMGYKCWGMPNLEVRHANR